jgi:hypothetical protein
MPALWDSTIGGGTANPKQKWARRLVALALWNEGEHVVAFAETAVSPSDPELCLASSSKTCSCPRGEHLAASEARKASINAGDRFCVWHRAGRSIALATIGR